MERFKYNKLKNENHSKCNISTVGGRIAYYRLESNMTQQELADESGLNRNTIVDYEKNNLSHLLKNINLIAAALKIVPSFIYDDYLNFISSNYGEQIKQLRKRMKLTQKQFCKKLGFNDTVGHWELNRSPPSRKNYEVLTEYIKD